jgi:hypothetical protein
MSYLDAILSEDEGTISSPQILVKEDDWMLKLIKNILKKYDLDLKVKKSVFTEKPMRPKFLKDHPMY